MRSDQKKGLLYLALTLTPYLIYHLGLAFHYGSRIGKAAQWILIALLVISTGSAFLIAIKRTKLSRSLIRVGLFWMGASLMLLITTILTIIAELFLSRTLDPAVPLGLAIVLTLYAIGSSQSPTAYHLKVKTRGEGNYRIAQISDVHLGDFYGERFLERALKLAQEHNPEVIVITGDLVDGTETPQERWFKPLGKVDVPILFVEGNHELYTNTKLVEQYLKEQKVKILNDKTALVKNIFFVGRVFRSKNKHNEITDINHHPAVLLQHEPEGTLQASEHGYDLMLSGHTHGAQIWPLHIIGELHYDHFKGTQKIGNMTLHINTGTGTWGPPLRLGTLSEVTIIDLHGENSQAKNSDQ